MPSTRSDQLWHNVAGVAYRAGPYWYRHAPGDGEKTATVKRTRADTVGYDAMLRRTTHFCAVPAILISKFWSICDRPERPDCPAARVRQLRTIVGRIAPS